MKFQKGNPELNSQSVELFWKLLFLSHSYLHLTSETEQIILGFLFHMKTLQDVPADRENHKIPKAVP
jgi:hypothetical protein